MRPTDRDYASRRHEQERVMDVIRSIANDYRAGRMTYQTASAQIEELLNGDAARIVRVGNTHTPEVET
jgi:hypothetical protein